MERLQNLAITNLSYDKVIIDTPIEETIIYLDIPYRNTEGYKVKKIGDFDYDYFDNWFVNHKYTLFLSEYKSPHKEIFKIDKRQTLNNNREAVKIVEEKLYVNK